MPRRPRATDAGAYNHITARGSGRRQIFEDDADKCACGTFLISRFGTHWEPIGDEPMNPLGTGILRSKRGVPKRSLLDLGADSLCSSNSSYGVALQVLLGRS